MFGLGKMGRAVVAAAVIGASIEGSAAAAKPARLGDLYVTSYNGGCTNSIAVIRNGNVARSWEPLDGPCTTASAIAVGTTIRTLGVRPEFTGAEYNLGGHPTGVTYSYPSGLVMDLPDGTTDGTFNYAGGYFDGVVYRFTRDWTDPVPLFSTGVYLGGITYDPGSDTLWVLDSRADFEGGTGQVRNYSKDGTLLSSFVVTGGSTPQPFGLAFDPRDDSLWLSRVVAFDSPIVLEEYSTSGDLLGTVTTGLRGIPQGMEFPVRGN